MSSKTPRGLSTRERTDESLQNQRVTARIVREPDGTRHHEYQANSRVYDSLDALLADVPESTHAQPRTDEMHVIDRDGNNA